MPTNNPSLDTMIEMAQQFFDSVPHNRALGIRYDRLGAREAWTRLPYAEHLVGDPDSGVIHGLGFRLLEQNGRPRGHLPFSEKLVGNPLLPALHGGTLGALLELTAIFTMLWSRETAVLPKTINLTIDYLRSARPADTFAEAAVTKHGRRVVNVQAEAWQEHPSKPVAIAYAHFLILQEADLAPPRP